MSTSPWSRWSSIPISARCRWRRQHGAKAIRSAPLRISKRSWDRPSRCAGPARCGRSRPPSRCPSKVSTSKALRRPVSCRRTRSVTSARTIISRWSTRPSPSTTRAAICWPGPRPSTHCGAASADPARRSTTVIRSSATITLPTAGSSASLRCRAGTRASSSASPFRALPIPSGAVGSFTPFRPRTEPPAILSSPTIPR